MAEELKKFSRSIPPSGGEAPEILLWQATREEYILGIENCNAFRFIGRGAFSPRHPDVGGGRKPL
ncbi:MAG: hypothetical protein ABJQ29_05120 [Luteolibacter sp.]